MTELKFKYIKDSKCPLCGAEIKNYRHTSKWGEYVSFECGFSIESKTPEVIKYLGMCKNSSEWEELKKSRLDQLDKVSKFIQENVKDKKLKKEFNEKIGGLKYNIKLWWCD